MRSLSSPLKHWENEGSVFGKSKRPVLKRLREFTIDDIELVNVGSKRFPYCIINALIKMVTYLIIGRVKMISRIYVPFSLPYFFL